VDLPDKSHPNYTGPNHFVSSFTDSARSYSVPFQCNTKGAPAKTNAPLIVPEIRLMSKRYAFLIAAWAAANLAIGTRNGEQET